MFEVGDKVNYMGNVWEVTRRNSMMTTTGALHRYSLRGTFGVVYEVPESELEEYAVEE